MKTTNELVRDIYHRLDQYSLVVQADQDPGDSAYRSAIFAFLLNAVKHPQSAEYYKIMIHNLSVGKGTFHRTPTPTHWGFNPNNFSRDQAAAVLLAASVNEDNETIDAFYSNSHKRNELAQIPKYGLMLKTINPILGFHQNVAPGTDVPVNFRKVPDLIGLGEVKNEIRRKKQWWKYPLLTIYDLDLLISLKSRKKQLWDFDSLYAKDLIYSNQHMPTLFSWFAKKLYAKTDYLERIRNNYADSNNGIEPLGELYELVCRKYINDENI